MMLCLVVYVIFAGKKGEAAAVMFFISLYKAIDCMSDSVGTGFGNPSDSQYDCIWNHTCSGS